MTMGRRDVAVRMPAPDGLDQAPPEHEGSPLAADQHQALVESLVDVLEATPERVEELLSLLHEELDEEGASEERVLDAFERGLQLGLLVGLGSRELTVPSTEGGNEGSAPASR
ncbi:MAG: hypothetical protein ACRDMH_02545 [Solirubrobacterales bacterium]